MPLGSKLITPRGSQFYIEIYKKKLQTTCSPEPLMGIPLWSPTKVVQPVQVGCISMSRGKK